MEAPLPGYAAIAAYKALRYAPLNDPNLPMVLRATIQLLFLTRTYHPDKTEFSAAPEAERTAAIDRLTAAVAPYELPTPLTHTFLPRTDPMRVRLGERIWEEERVREEARIREEARAREEEAAAFIVRLRTEPVVFRRDPEGSVDLRAFATDPESVHRSSVQSATERSIRVLMERDIPRGQLTLEEITICFCDPTVVRMNDVTRSRILAELNKDVAETVAFSTRYSDVLDRVWAFLQKHDNTRDLIIRLAQEICEGIDRCSNGKMARLVNTLQGYDDSLFVEPPKEAFQEKMARLMKRPTAERGPAATALFDEYAIVEAERGAWLEALED